MADDLLSAFRRAVAAHGPEVALVDGQGRQISFAALLGQAEGLAADLAARGIEPGDRVLLATPLDARLYASLAALWMLGAAAVFPEPALGIRGLRHAISTMRPKAFLSAGKYRWLHLLLPPLWRLRPLSANVGSSGPGPLPDYVPAPDDIALISFTSGTTGRPKTILRSHGFMTAQWRAVAPLMQTGDPGRDLVAFPVFVLVNLAAGRGSVLPFWRQGRETPDVGILALRCADKNITRLLVPPAICEALAKHGIPETVTTILTGGGPLYPDTAAALMTRKPALRLVTVYGSTEAEPIAEIDSAAITDVDRQAMRNGAGLLVGPPVPGLRLRIAGDEVQVAGDHVNRGYFDAADNAGNKIAEGDTVWHRTGDAGRMDGQGRLWLLGRHGQRVELAGGPAYPFQIETAARFWPGVTRAALISTASGPVLAVEGDETRLTEWRAAGAALGIENV
ncbi:MAG: AMP-binding protein, partial [Paracoccaceae bacterium]